MEKYCTDCIFRKCETCSYYDELDDDCNYIYEDIKECICVGCYHGSNRRED
jgi:hypothetical protein